MTAFKTHTIDCDVPSPEQIQDVYRELPRKGRVKASVALDSLPASLAAFEQAGFFGISLNSMSPSCEKLLVTAYKGKAGPCYDGGRTATLKGPAVAVMDDDNHLIFGEIAVCEKTAALYQLPVYNPFIDLSDGDPALLDKFDDEPVLFDCDTFQNDMQRLSVNESWAHVSDATLEPVMYRGPFKVIICADGRLVRRGQPVLVPKSIVAEFSSYDSFLHLSDTVVQAEPAPYFKDAFARAGDLCLLGEPLSSVIVSRDKPADLELLASCSDPITIRLLGTIERGDSHFILTGSDPDAAFGCCPSADVGEAMRLVDAGILELFRVDAPADSCTSTIFAFHGEINQTGGLPTFTLNTAFRELVKMAFYEQRQAPQAGLVQTVIKYSLLTFVAIALGVAVIHAVRAVKNARVSIQHSTGNATFTSTLGLADGVTVVVIRKNIMCDTCRTAIRLCDDVVKNGNGDLAFRAVSLDNSSLMPLLTSYSMPDTLSILVVAVDDGREVKVTNLTPQFWNTLVDESAFKAHLQHAIQVANGELADG